MRGERVKMVEQTPTKSKVTSGGLGHRDSITERQGSLVFDTSTQDGKAAAFVEAFGQVQAKTTVVVPAFNEETGLPLVLEALFGVLDETYEVLVVDDGSTDGSVDAAAAFPCRIIRHPYNLGKGSALRTGLQHAQGENVIFIDADNTYPVELIPPLVKQLDSYDLARGVRQDGREHIPFLNRVGNFVFDSVTRMLCAVEGGDVLSGMYGGRRDCLLALGLESEGFDIEAEICVKSQAHGLTCGTVPITYVERVGEKKLCPLLDGMRILYRVLQLTATYNPLLVFIFPGLLLFLIGFLAVGWMLIDPTRFTDYALAANGTFVLGVIGALGAQLIVFGVAVYAAGMAYGLRGRANRSLDRATCCLSSHLAMLTGLGLGVVGAVGLLGLVADWILRGGGPFSDTAWLVLFSLCLLFGLQLLSSSAFLCIFKRLQPGVTKRRAQ